MDFDDDQGFTPVQRVECQYCGRKFAFESIARHTQICQKTSKKRAVFDSSKQRSVAESGVKGKPSQRGLGKPGRTLGTQGSKSNWRLKHEEFINTVRAARESTAAIKQGRKPPPPVPAAVNPDYVQCPHCLRRFNETAAERHIPFCAEQHKRMSNKKLSAPTSGLAAQAAARAAARQYRPPSLRPGGSRKSDGVEISKSAPPQSTRSRHNNSPSTNTRFAKEHGRNQYTSPSFSNELDKLTQRKGSANAKRQHIPEWDSTVEPSSYNLVARSKTGLKPVSTIPVESGKSATQRASPHCNQNDSKPVVRKFAGKSGKSVKTNGIRTGLPMKAFQDWSSEDFHHDAGHGDNDYKRDVYQSHVDKHSGRQHQTINDDKEKRGAYRGDYSVNTFTKKSLKNSGLNGKQYDWLQALSDDHKYTSHSSFNVTSQSQLSRFCHECGARYPIANAKFCCECGVKRLALS